MRSRTQDNLIYLAVGFCVAALVAFDFFWADSQGRKMWWPSAFAFRAVAYTAVLGYFVARETLKVKATLFQALMCVLVAGALHLSVAFAFRGTFSGRFGIGLWALAILEVFVIVQLMVQVVLYLRTKSQRTQTSLK